ncbi:right-handed parallel beta-helix repeat-containing protein [Nonomuraea dietziae]|uniref:right-handed parallel beta-helix repeat-containing protein n=1 Tax=Nonomuraea dietziae TaxID=65515 RepID=UPI003433C5EF
MTAQETPRRRVLAGLGLLGAAVTVPLAAATPAEASLTKPDDLNAYPAIAYGAIADGVADDAAALQRAIDAAAAAGGGTVHLAAGHRYLIGTSLKLKSGVALVSDRSRASIVLTAGYGEPQVISATGVSTVALRNLKIMCDERPSLVAGVLVTGGTDVLVDNVHVEGISAGTYDVESGEASSALIRFLNSRRVHIIGCRVTKAYVGINVAGNSSHVTIDDCDVHDVTQFGVHVLGNATSHTEHLTVSRCRLERIGGTFPQVGYPIYITAGGNKQSLHKHRYVRAMDNSVVGNRKAYGKGGNADLLAVYDIFDGVFERNVLFYGGDAGLSTDRCRKLVIANNIVGYCNTVGINVWQSNDVTVVGNVVYNNHQNYGGGLSVEARGGIRTYARAGFKAENVVITGNRCFDDQQTKTQDYGIFIHERTKGVDIGANTLTGNKEGMFKTGSKENITYSFVVTLDALPTTGYWEKGMVVQLRDPAPGQPLRWVCVVADTPGTWRPEAAQGVPASITAVPSYQGQLALQGAALYVATGTASAADWRKVADLPA